MVMGIYDREYYRREGPSILGSFTERGTVCKWLIAINVILFILQHLIPPPRVQAQAPDLGPDDQEEVAAPRGLSPVTSALMLDAREAVHGQGWRLLTYALLHDPYNFMPILFNMLFLCCFGNVV